jgi:DNA-binding transcriptional LysR family regulator
MKISQLEYFRTIARLENMSQAAKVLYVSQPGLSRFVTKLEKEIGVPLFERRKGRIVLNSYGKLFLNVVNEAFDFFEDGVKRVQNEYLCMQEVLMVASSIDDYLADRLQEFRIEHPEISIKQLTYSLSEIEDPLIHQNLDLAICTHALPGNRLQYEKLSACPYVLVCHRENPLARRNAVFMEEAREQPFICVNPALNSKNLEKMLGFSPRIDHEVGSGYVLFNILKTNAGVALVPLAHYLRIVQKFSDHSFRMLRVKDELPAAEIGIVCLAGRELPLNAKMFIGFLRRKETELLSDMECFLAKGAFSD